MFLSPVDEQEIIIKTKCQRILLILISAWSKQLLRKIVKPLNHICNVSFKTGMFPNQIKIAKVIPVFKAGAKCVFTNCRLIIIIIMIIIIKVLIYRPINRDRS